MAQDRSLTELRQEADRARAGLAQAVDEIRARATPAGLADRLVQSARDNPLQAIAVGASVAYPLLKAYRAAPAPLWLIGAGLFLSSTSAGKSASRRATDLGADMADKVSQAAANMSKAVADSANAGLAAARQTAAAVSETASAGQEAVKQKANAIADASVDQATRAADRLLPSKEQVTRAVETTRAAVAETNVLLLGGVGLAIGALLASAIPSTSTEDRWVGGASDRAKGRARESVSQAFDAAQAAARSAAERAEQEGLTGEQLKAKAEDYAHRVRKVAESAAEGAAEKQGEKTH